MDHATQRSNLTDSDRNVWWMLLVGFTVFACFFQVKNHDYIHYDDPHFISEVPQITTGLSWDNIKWAATSRDQRNWTPLARWSHQLDTTLFGNHPGPAHLVSVFWHSVNASLVFLLLKRFGLSQLSAILGALIWAMHPMQAESTAWLSNRKHLLTATGALGATLCWWPSTKRPFPRRGWATLLLALSLMARPTAVLLPLAWMAGDAWYFRKDCDKRHSRLLNALPVSLSPLVIGATLWASALPQHELMSSPESLDGFWMAPVAAWELISKIFAPRSLAFHYPIPSEIPWIKVIGGTLLICFTLTIIYRRRRRHTPISLSLLWAVLLWLPASNIKPMGDLLTADRFVYLPLVGLLVTGVCIFSRLPETTKNVGMSVVLLLCVFQTWGLLNHWKDSPSLFAYASSCQPKDPLPLTQWGMWHVSRGELHEAKHQLSRALEADNKCLTTHYNLSVTLLQLSEPQEALTHASVVIDALPKFAAARWNRAQCYFQLAELSRSLVEVKAVLELEPNYIPAQARLAELQSIMDAKRARQRKPHAKN